MSIINEMSVSDINYNEKIIKEKGIFPLQEKDVTENGTVVADPTYNGLSKVNVNVQGGGGSEYHTASIIITDFGEDKIIGSVTSSDINEDSTMKLSFSLDTEQGIIVPTIVTQTGIFESLTTEDFLVYGVISEFRGSAMYSTNQGYGIDFDISKVTGLMSGDVCNLQITGVNIYPTSSNNLLINCDGTMIAV